MKKYFLLTALLLLCAATYTGLPIAPTNAVMKEYPSWQYFSVLRLGVNSIGDAPPQWFIPTKTSCSITGGDVGSEVPTFDGGCFNANFQSNRIDIREWGVKGNGVTDVTAGVQAAINGTPNGDALYFPSTGASYVFVSGVVIPYGRSITIQGAGLYNAPLTPFDNTESHWTNVGTWFKCTSQVVPCWTFQNNGWTFSGVNFWQTQPTPTNQVQCSNPCTMTTGFVPTVYGPLIYINGTAINSSSLANYWNIRDIRAANCMSSPGCIEIVGNNGSGTASTVSPHLYSHIEHSYIGNLGVGLYEQYVDNDIVLNDVKFELPWENYSSDVLEWTEGTTSNPGHKIDESWNYVAGQVQVGVEHDFSAIGIEVNNASITEPFGTLQIGAQAFSLVGENFNEVCRGIYTPATSGSPANPTLLQGIIEGGILSTDFVTSPIAGQCANGTGNPYAFDLQSSGVNIEVNGLQAYDVQSLLNSIGTVVWNGANTLSYSNYSTGGNAVIFGIGSNIQLNGLSNLVTLNPNAGAKFSGTPSPLVFGGGIGIDGPASTTHFENSYHLSTNCAVNGCKSIQSWAWGEDSTNAWTVYRFNQSTGAFVDVPIGISPSTGYFLVNDGLLLGIYTIGGLPSCGVGTTGVHLHVSNGVASPTFWGVVGTTGSTEDPVYCNGSNWVYE